MNPAAMRDRSFAFVDSPFGSAASESIDLARRRAEDAANSSSRVAVSGMRERSRGGVDRRTPSGGRGGPGGGGTAARSSVEREKSGRSEAVSGARAETGRFTSSAKSANGPSGVDEVIGRSGDT